MVLAYSERYKAYPDKVIISYPFAWAGMRHADKSMWMAELNGEVLNYNPKDMLIKDAIKDGRGYVVLRVHRDGTITARIVAAEAEGESHPKKRGVL